jgi:hypothetical protein
MIRGSKVGSSEGFITAQITESGMTVSMPVHGHRSGYDMMYPKTYPRPPRAIRNGIPS